MERSEPILDILPSGLKLFPYETRHHVEKPPARTLPRYPSSLEQFLRLNQVTQPADIGKFGPSIAALSFETGETTPDHLTLYDNDARFGRDTLTVAAMPEILQSYPNLAKNTLLELATTQGITTNQSRDEQPGQIAHEVRDPNSKKARELTRDRGWGWPYYGSVDATATFIRTMHAYCTLAPDNINLLFHPYADRAGVARIMADSLTFATDWILNRLNQNPEGLLEYKAALPGGIENQVWKDSWDAYHHADGTIANHDKGIASIEVQTGAYDALLDAADLYDSLNRTDQARLLRERAATLKTKILDLFWTDDKGGYFVLGTDRDEEGALRQLKIRTSNMGHVLNSRLLDGDNPDSADKRNKVVAQLMSPGMLSHTGVRTLADDEVLFRPGSYHNGSVWTVDNFIIAQGLRHHNYTHEAEVLEDCCLTMVEDTNSFAEYSRGDHKNKASLNKYIIDINDHRAHRINRLEQPPQEVQAWTVAAILAIKIRRGREARERYLLAA
jgi:glycogen debranching enzyme